jgi:hypothetical protein
MKKINLFFISVLPLFFGIILIAQAPVSLQHNGVTTMFYTSTGFTDAYNAAVSGDTIYLPGGFFAGLTIDKRLAIIGAGHNPDSSINTFTTQINGNLTLGPNSDSTHIEGLRITGNLFVSTAGIKTDKLKISRNIVDGQLNLDGNRVTPSLHVEISGNVIRSTINLSNTENLVFCNNIIQSRVNYVYQGSITNNVFTSNPYWGSPYYTHINIFAVDNSKIENNVFVSTEGGTIVYHECDNSLFNKNLFALNSSVINFTNNMAAGNYT